jgi:hypothetical protein
MKLFVPGEAYYITYGSSTPNCFNCFNHFLPQQQAISRVQELKPDDRFPRAFDNRSFVYSSCDC